MTEHFKLRALEIKDAPLMLEWMHDVDVVENLQNNFAVKTLEDCVNFIKMAENDTHSLHLAIVNSANEYLGTVSLKNIEEKTAEFAITIRKSSMGSGCSAYAMREIIEKGFQELGLKEIYWCVSDENRRAVRFYDKNCYERVALNKLIVSKDVIEKVYSQEQMEKYIWYHVIR